MDQSYFTDKEAKNIANAQTMCPQSELLCKNLGQKMFTRQTIKSVKYQLKLVYIYLPHVIPWLYLKIIIYGVKIRSSFYFLWYERYFLPLKWYNY